MIEESYQISNSNLVIAVRTGGAEYIYRLPLQLVGGGAPGSELIPIALHLRPRPNTPNTKSFNQDYVP